MSDDATPPKRWPARHPCAFAALGLALLLVVLGGLAWWGVARMRLARDEVFAVALRRIVDSAPLNFAPDGVAIVLDRRVTEENVEVARVDQAEVLAALAPLGEVESITLLSAVDRDPVQPVLVRCRVEGTRATREVTFTFEDTRQPTIAVWWALRSAKLE